MLTLFYTQQYDSPACLFESKHEIFISCVYEAREQEKKFQAGFKDY
jgi:hypothetical protein